MAHPADEGEELSSDSGERVERIRRLSEYSRKARRVMPRLPLKGSIDLTYRCNNNCRHCWLRIPSVVNVAPLTNAAPLTTEPSGAPERQQELTLNEIKHVVDEARAMGCREWAISGGEPMLRPDFLEIFDYITRKAVRYSINTNGTLITPQIAQLMRRKGNKMVALYGATAQGHDHITRRPGSFDATIQGIAYLREAGAGFTVQLVPMRDNYHQWDEMVALAESLSPRWRVGASWLYLSASGDPARNQEIVRQRLDPRDVIELDQPDFSYGEWKLKEQEMEEHTYHHMEGDDRLFAPCIAERREFHVDPYGQMTFCDYVKDPALRYDLRQGSFREAWEEFIPSLADEVRGGPEYLEHCGSCDLRGECRWCPVFGYLEHRRLSAPVPYLCSVAREGRRFREDWLRNHRRYYQCAGITILVESDLPIAEDTFHPKFEHFRVDGPGEDTISIRHHFSLPDLHGKDLGQEVYRNPPWAIYEKGDSWVYVGFSPADGVEYTQRVVVFNHDYTRARIYNVGDEVLHVGNHRSLTFFPTDQVLLAPLLPDRQACYLHSSGVILDDQGLLFVGHSEAGKSTMVKMLMDHAEILCDDRNIVRRWPDGFKVHGTWSHGEVPVVSGSSAPLRAILFLEKAPENRLMPLDDRREIVHKLLACLIKPFVTANWWEKTLDLVEQIAQEVPCYTLRFDKSGEVVEVLREFVQGRALAK